MAKRRQFVGQRAHWAYAVAMIFLALPVLPAAPPSSKPNIAVMLADDTYEQELKTFEKAAANTQESPILASTGIEVNCDELALFRID